jgi:integral membrane sensor domain MASE1
MWWGFVVLSNLGNDNEHNKIRVQTCTCVQVQVSVFVRVPSTIVINFFLKHKNQFWLFIALLVAFALRVHKLGAQSLWYGR